MKKIIKFLESKSKILRRDIIKISYKKKTHHIGSCLSCVEILIFVFFNFLKIDKSKKKENDFFILSKGHAALSYYIILKMKKFFSYNFLMKNYISNGGLLGGHPDRNTKLGIDYCSGSLGNGLSVGCGVSLSYLKDRAKKKVLVILGDGECNEGMIWESALFAGHHKLSNLFVTSLLPKNEINSKRSGPSSFPTRAIRIAGRILPGFMLLDDRCSKKTSFKLVLSTTPCSLKNATATLKFSFVSLF